MAKFEVVSKYKDAGLALPERKTKLSAGYDLAAAQEVIIPPYEVLMDKFDDYDCEQVRNRKMTLQEATGTKTLEEMAARTKAVGAKPTLVSTGMKCKLDPGTYLELSARSSTPLKYWLVLANGEGIIDADYYNNASNEGEIYLQFINFSPYPIKIQKGEFIGQGIIKSYLITEDDNAEGERVGGFGSTTK